jgi:hypothetical protein
MSDFETNPVGTAGRCARSIVRRGGSGLAEFDWTSCAG